MSRVTTDDLDFAIEWLGYYDGEASVENAAARDRVSAWLTKEARRRDFDAQARIAAKENNVAVSVAKKALRRAGWKP